MQGYPLQYCVYIESIIDMLYLSGWNSNVQEPRIGSLPVTPLEFVLRQPWSLLGVWGNISTRKPFTKGSVDLAHVNIICCFEFLMLME